MVLLSTVLSSVKVLGAFLSANLLDKSGHLRRLAIHVSKYRVWSHMVFVNPFSFLHRGADHKLLMLEELGEDSMVGKDLLSHLISFKLFRFEQGVFF